MSEERQRLHRNVWAATGTSFLTDVSSEMLHHLLPLFLANVLGVRVWTVGVIYGLSDTAASVLKLYSGWLSDRLRARKWLAVAGYATSGLSRPFLYVASTWGAVGAIRFADRVGKGIRTAPRDALLADSTPPASRAFAFGLHRAGDSAGAVTGLLVAIWVVASTQGASAFLAEHTFRTLVLWSLVPALLSVLVLAVGARDVVSPTGAGTAPRIRIRALGRGFAAFTACSVLFEVGNSADAFLVLRAQERGLSVVGVLWILVAFNVVYTAVSAPAGSLADRVPRRRVVLAGWLVYAVVYLGFAVARSPVHIVVLYSLYGIYHGLVAGAAKALIADLVPAELRGTAYGSYAALVGLISLPASLLAGVLWQGVGSWSGFGAAAPFALGAATAALASVFLVWSVPDRLTRPAITQPSIPVVAAVVARRGRYLVGRRPEHKRHGGLWEFPGGKVGAGESMAEAASRELAEELSLHTNGVGPTLFSCRDGAAPFEIHFVEVQVEGEPVAHEHTEVGWFTPSELGGLPLAPADAAFVAELRRPRE